MIGTIVIGGYVQGLGLIRSLAAEGVPVSYLDTTPYNVPRFSKYCDKFIKMPRDTYQSDQIFTDYFVGLAKHGMSERVILPTDDKTVAFLSRNKNKLSKHFIIPVPDWDITQKCYNKILTYEVCKNIGVPIPKSSFPKSIADLAEIDEIFQYPIIIKPAVMHEFYEKTRSKVIIVQNSRELKVKYIEACSIIKPENIIIQEIIPGTSKNLYSLGSFFKNGKTLAYIMARRSRQIPMDFGKASTFAELCEIPEIYKSGNKLLKAVNYYGLSEVEFKRDPRDGEYKLLEINPRTWKWHSIAQAAGINLPYLLYCDLLGNEFKTSKFIPGNIKWIDLYPDLYISVSEMIKGKLNIKDYFQSLKGKKVYSVWSLDDPMPFIMETILIPYLFMSRW